MQKYEVAVNLAQDFTDEQKAQARANIGADFIVRYYISDRDNYLHDYTKRVPILEDPSGFKKVTTSEFNSLKVGNIVLIMSDRTNFGGIPLFAGEVHTVGGPLYCNGTQINEYASRSIINLKLSSVDSSDPNSYVTAIQVGGTPIGNYISGTSPIVSVDNLYNNVIRHASNPGYSSITFHIQSDTSILEENHACIEFDNDYNSSCDIEIIDDNTNTKLRYDTAKGYTIPANTFVQITVLGSCWTFKEYTQPSP